MRFLSIFNSLGTGDQHFREVIRHASWALGLLVFGTIVQFGFDFSLTHTFKAHGAGIFYLCLSVVLILAMIGRLGFDRAVVRFIPPLLKKDPGAAAGVSKTAIQLSLVLTLPTTVLLYILAPLIADKIFHSPGLTQYLRVFAFAVPALSLNYVFSGILRALKHTKSALSIERLTMYALGIFAVLIVGHKYGLVGATIGFVVAIYISTIEGGLYIKRWHPDYKTIIPFSKKQMLITSGPLLFVAFATQMNGQASVLLLGAFSPHADVGIFSIALKISILMNLVLTAINVIAATKISELYFSNRHKELNVMLEKISALGALVGLPTFIVLAAFSHFWLGLFGSEFVAGSTALILLCAGQLVNVAAGSTGFVLAMTEHERSLAVAVGASLVFNVGLGLVLIPRYGVAGAGITAGLTIVVNNIIMILMVKRYLGTWMLPFKYMAVWSRHIMKNTAS